MSTAPKLSAHFKILRSILSRDLIMEVCEGYLYREVISWPFEVQVMYTTPFMQIGGCYTFKFRSNVSSQLLRLMDKRECDTDDRKQEARWHVTWVISHSWSHEIVFSSPPALWMAQLHERAGAWCPDEAFTEHCREQRTAAWHWHSHSPPSSRRRNWVQVARAEQAWTERPRVRIKR